MHQVAFVAIMVPMQKGGGEMPWKSCCAILVAAGNSSRMGAQMSKQFLALCGKPVIVHTMLAFEQAEHISSIVVVCREEDRAVMQQLANQYAVHKLYAVVPGGTTRQRSVAAGVAAVPKDTAYLAIHDGARPLIQPKEIDATVQDAYKYGAATFCTAVKDTIKIQDGDGFISSTPVRDSLRAVQTPQVFERSLYERALSLADQECADYTDDCQLVEHIGYKVHLFTGGYTNIKITTPEDLPTAEAILKQKRGGWMRIGHGYDVHRLASDRKLVLGGTEIPYEKGLLGHSDADVLTHAVMDALLGAAALGDIGTWFPDTDPTYKGADSILLLQEVVRLLQKHDYQIANIDATILAQEPKLKPYIQSMRSRLADAMGITLDQVSIKATTEEGLGFTGEKQGIAVHAVCLLEK